MIQVHDFNLLAGGPRCSFIVGGAEPIVYVGEQPLTLAQLEELHSRALDFDFEEEYDD